MVQKVNVTSAQLKQWLVENGVKLSGLEREMGVAQPYLSSFFNKTTKGRRGGVRYFTPVVTDNLNAAMHQVAERLRGMLINLNTEEPGVMGRKLMYYPVVLERIQALRTYLMLKAFMRKTLGWTYNITSAKLMNPANSNYGHITMDDATHIDTALLQLAAALDSFQMVPDSAPKAQVKNEGVKSEKCKPSDIRHRTSINNGQRTTYNGQQSTQPSDIRHQTSNSQFSILNSQLDEDPVLAQWRAAKEEYPKSVVIFRHEGIYVTVADDAELVARITPLKAEHHSGTALCVFTDADLDVVLPPLVREDVRIVFQDLKKEG